MGGEVIGVGTLVCVLVDWLESRPATKFSNHKKYPGSNIPNHPKPSRLPKSPISSKLILTLCHLTLPDLTPTWSVYEQNDHHPYPHDG